MDDPSLIYNFVGLCICYALFLIFRISALYFLTRGGFYGGEREKRSSAEAVIPDRVFNGLFLLEVALILLAADGFRRAVGELAPAVPRTASYVAFAAIAFALRAGARALLPATAAYLLGAFTAPVARLLGYMVAAVFWAYVKVCGVLGALLRAERRPTAVAPDAETLELYRADKQQNLEEGEEEMIEAIINIRDTRAREVMVPRVDIVAVPETATVNEIKALVVKHGFSRLPVYMGTIDNVVGILHAKDLFLAEDAGVEVGSLLRKPYYVPDSKKVNEILAELQEHKTQIAIVVDEYGGTAGLITLEDVIEEIVGEIHDEYDAQEFTYEELPDGSYRVSAKMDLEEVSEALGIVIPVEDFETLGGFIIAREGNVPAAGELLQYDNFDIEVLESDDRRVKSVRIIVKPTGDEPAGG